MARLSGRRSRTARRGGAAAEGDCRGFDLGKKARLEPRGRGGAAQAEQRGVPVGIHGIRRGLQVPKPVQIAGARQRAPPGFARAGVRRRRRQRWKDDRSNAGAGLLEDPWVWIDTRSQCYGVEPRRGRSAAGAARGAFGRAGGRACHLLRVRRRGGVSRFRCHVGQPQVVWNPQRGNQRKLQCISVRARNWRCARGFCNGLRRLELR